MNNLDTLPEEEVAPDFRLAGDRHQHAKIRNFQLVGETPSWIWAWSLICSEKKNCSLWENYHATVRSEAIACTRRCQSAWLTGWRTGKEYWKNWRAKE
jgi:hypothetical protein